MTRRNWWKGSVFLLAATIAWSLANAAPPKEDVEDVDDGSFGLSTPIACKDVRGFEDYEVFPEAAFTHDEKLIVYFLPRHFKAEKKGKKYEVRFTQEGRVKRRGEKAVLWTIPRTLEFKTEAETPPKSIYLVNRLALKDLKPGEYDYEILLRDAVSGIKAAPRIMPFTILPSPETKEKTEPDRP